MPRTKTFSFLFEESFKDDGWYSKLIVCNYAIGGNWNGKFSPYTCCDNA